MACLRNLTQPIAQPTHPANRTARHQPSAILLKQSMKRTHPDSSRLKQYIWLLSGSGKQSIEHSAGGGLRAGTHLGLAVGFIQKLPTQLIAAFRCNAGRDQEADGWSTWSTWSIPDAASKSDAVLYWKRHRVSDIPWSGVRPSTCMHVTCGAHACTVLTHGTHGTSTENTLAGRYRRGDDIAPDIVHLTCMHVMHMRY
jgi:hypothetical protein